MKKITIKEIIEKVFDQLEKADVYFGHGTTNAWDEAVWLVLEILDPEQLKDFLGDELVGEKDLIRIEALLERRIKEQKPLAYLIHKAYFMEMPFYVDERVLIPRSPIAELIERQFSPWIHHPQEPLRILDLCTGSGCIAIGCAKAFPQAQVFASDISPEALEVAAINVEKHHLKDRVTLIESDLFQKIPNEKFDLIVSNPPYITEQEMREVPAEYKHEPSLALVSGVKGLNAVEKIIQESPQYLKEKGVLVVEVGDRQLVEKQFPKHSFLWLEFERGEGDVFLIKNYGVRH